MDKYELRSKARTLDTTVTIGKEGLTEGMIRQIKQRLHQNKLVKIKILSSAAKLVSKKQFGHDLAEATQSILIDNIGFVYVLADKSVVHE